MASEIQLGGKTIFTQDGNNMPEMHTNVVIPEATKKSTFDSPDTETLNSSSSNIKDVNLPIFAVRAWANFNGLNADTASINGEACCLIYGSGNINRIVRTEVGHYRVYFDPGV